MEGGANGVRREVHEEGGGDQLAASEGHVVSYELRIGQSQARMSKVCMTCTCKVDEKMQATSQGPWISLQYQQPTGGAKELR